MKSNLPLLVCCLVLLLTASPAFATTHHVPADFTTIQSGLDASAQGDTVLVQPGTYVENIVWPQINGIKLIAAGNFANTIIRANTNARAIAISSNGLIDTETQICGFTIKEGSNVSHGAGIYCDGSSPTIVSCKITENSTGYTAYSSGAGLYCGSDTHHLILDCVFQNNQAGESGMHGMGGGIYCASSSNPTIVNCSFYGNSADDGGAVFYGGESNPELQDCNFQGNFAENGGAIYTVNQFGTEIVGCTFVANHAGDGGAIYCFQFGPAIINCQFSWNHADHGGALCLFGSTEGITDCTFTNNTAQHLGGGIDIYGPATIRRCVIAENQGSHGGGIALHASDTHIDFCTIRYNEATGDNGLGAGIYFWNDSQHGSRPILSNSIVSNNDGEGVYSNDSSTSFDPMIRYCDFHDNGDFDFAGSGIDSTWGLLTGVNANGDSCDVYNNIFLDPLYVDPDNYDFHLQSGSPCIDAGDPDSPLDPDDTIADIGAFYFDHNVGVLEHESTTQPTKWALLPAYPNPFNASTTIRVTLAQPSSLDVRVINTAGQIVADLAHGRYASGVHEFSFDASALASGMYFVHARVPGRLNTTRKMLLLR